jgi:hypothetical protein
MQLLHTDVVSVAISLSALMAMVAPIADGLSLLTACEFCFYIYGARSRKADGLFVVQGSLWTDK